MQIVQKYLSTPANQKLQKKSLQRRRFFAEPFYRDILYSSWRIVAEM